MTKPPTYHVLGLMSGTSLDGVDIAYVEFVHNRKWKFQLLASETVAYSRKWEHRLGSAHDLSSEELAELHGQYGRYLGEQCMEFIDRHSIRRVDLVASHGHTIFHQPTRGFTFQLGDGAALYATTGLPVVYDFRSLDVQLGGEGAPLVPVGDRLLFASADVCLNLGGIANLSMEIGGERRAFDLCFCNMALNFLAKEVGKSYDRHGKKASKGAVDGELLEALGGVYASIRKKRKSIGRELFESAVRPLLANRKIRLADRLRTVCESVAQEVEEALPPASRNLQILTTGGGALNRFLVEVIRGRLLGKGVVALPAREIVDFKEAIVFALLGVLRVRNEINVLRSVTRARRDSCSGIVIGY
jgi:anhydro-N-acetylmuramic acid kinase